MMETKLKLKTWSQDIVKTPGGGGGGGGVLPYVCILGMCRTRDLHFQP